MSETLNKGLALLDNIIKSLQDLPEEELLDPKNVRVLNDCLRTLLSVNKSVSDTEKSLYENMTNEELEAELKKHEKALKGKK